MVQTEAVSSQYTGGFLQVNQITKFMQINVKVLKYIGQLVGLLLLKAGCIIPLFESSLSTIDIHSFNLFKRIGMAETLLEIFCLSNCIFSELSSSPSVAKILLSPACIYKAHNG